MSETKRKTNRIAFMMARLERLQPPEKGRMFVHDSGLPGLALCLTAAGSKVYYVYTWHDGRPVQIRIAKFPALNVEKARERKYRPHDNAFFEYAVMRALANIGAPEAIDPIIALLGHAHVHVRSSAASALGLFGGERALEALIVALNDDDSRVRRSAARSLGNLGGPRAVRPLVRAMSDRFGSVRAAVVTALGKIGGAKAMQVVEAAVDDRSNAVYYAADAALRHINAKSTDRQTLPE